NEHQHPDAPRLLQLLRAHRERPRCRTAKKCDELAPPHTGPKGVALREFYLVLGLVTRKFGLNNGSDGMSALGQKQTFAVQNGMSALPPKADIRCSSRNHSFSLAPSIWRLDRKYRRGRRGRAPLGPRK